MKNILLVLGLLWIGLSSFTSKATIEGKVLEEGTTDPVIFANVVLFKGGVRVGVKSTDFDGNYKFENLEEGVYEIEVSYIGFDLQKIKGIKVEIGKTNRVDIIMTGREVQLEEVVVTEYKVPLIEQDNTTQGAVLTSDDIRNLPTRNINGLTTNTAGISTAKKDKAVKIRGSRSKATDYYADGIRVSGNLSSNQPIALPDSKMPTDPQRPKEIVENNESYDQIQENSFKAVTTEAVSTFSIDVDAASYSNLRRFINSGYEPPVDAVRIEEMVNYFDYDYPTPTNGEPFQVITEYAECPWAKDHKLLHIGLQGMKISNDNLPATNLVFLIDVSGSMNSSNKLPLLKESFKLLVQNLRRQDRVAMVVYAGAAGLVLPPTSGKDKQAILNALNELSAGGSTAGGAGIQLAYKTARENFIEGGNNRVILATDGDFNVGMSDDNQLVKLIEKERESGVFLTVMGFGRGNYKDAKMQKLANKGNGNHAYIDQLSEAKKVLVNEFGGTLFTIAKDVKLQLEFNPAQVKGFRLIGYENRLLNREDFDDDTKDAGELGAGHTVTALYEIIPNDVESPFLANTDLKYQEITSTPKSEFKDELMTVKLRYKPRDGNKSKLIKHSVDAKALKLNESSDNFRWSASVAAFGMLLRDSKFKGDASFKNISDLAKAAKGKDENGYRKEFIELIQKAEVSKKVMTVPKPTTYNP